jgi:hypothetical protein
MTGIVKMTEVPRVEGKNDFTIGVTVLSKLKYPRKRK